MDFRILGPLEVEHEGRKLPLGGRQQSALLALLLLHANEVVAVDEIIDELWPESPPPSATRSVHALVSRLRRLLEGEPVARNGAESDNAVLLTRAHGYLLRVAPGELDLHRFESLLNEGRAALAAGQAEVAAQTLRKALALWRGQPLTEFASGSCAAAEIARLNELRLLALEERIEAGLAAGRTAVLVAELEALVAAHPLRERLRGQLMRALYGCGRQVEALQVYQDTRRLLVDELGIEPSQTLKRLEQAILRQERSLEPRARVAPDRRRSVRRRAALAGVVALLAAAAVLAAILGTRSEPAPAVHVLGNSLAVIDPRSNRVERQIPVGARPAFVAHGDRALWVANLDDNSISRVDPRTSRVVRMIATDASPAGIAVGADSVWVANSDAATISRIDPRYDRSVQTIPIPGPSGFGLSAITFGLGSVWVAHSGGTVSRIDPRGGRVIATIVVGNEPRAIAVGAGAVWVANAWWEGTVSRIDPSNVVTAEIPVGRGAVAVAVGAGAVWVANALDDTVLQIDPATNAIKATIPVGKRLGGIAVGAGAVWVTGSGDGTIFRIDPRTSKVVDTIRVGSNPVGVAASGGTVWVTAQDDVPAPRETAAASAGGIVHVNVEELDFTDPAVAYWATSWQLEHATCAKLLNYPDRPAPAGSRLVPEVAQSLPLVSPDGTRYTFTIRDDFRFSPPSNERVTAQTFKYAIERSLSPKLRRSPAAEFVGDIVGVSAYRKGGAQHISGVVARGNKLTIELTRPARDLPARLAMPFFCSVPVGTPADPNGLPAIPSAGPYYVASYTPKQHIVIRRNPNYRGPRPHRLDEIVYTIGVTNAQTVAQVRGGRADYAADGIPPAADSRLAARYGTGSAAAKAGRKQYFREPLLGVVSLALNTSRPLFADVKLRQAVNYAIDRPALARQHSATSFALGEPTDQYLPPGVPGFRDVRIYPLDGPDFATASRLAAGRGGRAVLYTCNVAPCPQQAQIVQANLKAIGIDVEVKKFPYGVLGDKITTRGEPFDMFLNGWILDYPDPFNVLNNLFDGAGINARHNAAGGYLNDPAFNRRLEAAATLTGPERYRAYGALDVDLARNAAPIVAIATYAHNDFFSARIGCYTYQPVYGFDLAALCLKRPGRTSRAR
jgi:YVTN family beta-propeller protein